MVVLLIHEAYGLSIGCSPGVIEIGDVERGKSYVGEFYVLSDTKRNLIVELSSFRPERSFFVPYSRSYEFEEEEASEEDASSWLTFIENPVIIKPHTQEYLFNGVRIRGNKRVTFLLKIPEDAEPGYHLIGISPSPRTMTTGMGFTVSAVAVVNPFVSFRVEGEAIRSGKIVYFDSPRVSEEYERIDVYVANNGTVTMSIGLSKLKIYDMNGTLLANFSSNNMIYVKPKEKRPLSVFWNVKNVKSGSYKVTACVAWFTGEACKEGVIKLKPFVPKISKAVKVKKPQTNIFIFILLFTFLMLLIIYIKIRRKRK
jgi:hypothetical protein